MVLARAAVAVVLISVILFLVTSKVHGSGELPAKETGATEEAAVDLPTVSPDPTCFLIVGDDLVPAPNACKLYEAWGMFQPSEAPDRYREEDNPS